MRKVAAFLGSLILPLLILNACTTSVTAPKVGPPSAGAPAMTATATWATSPTSTPTAPPATPTGSPTSTRTATFTSTWTHTPNIPISTPTYTRTPTYTYTPTRTFTPYGSYPTATPTATGCGKICSMNSGGYPTTVSASAVTVVGIRFSTYQCYSYCPKCITQLTFTLSLSGNLSTEIQGAELWKYGELVTTSTLGAGNQVIFNNGGILGSADSSWEVKYIVSPAASGVVKTNLTDIVGYQTGYGIGSAWDAPPNASGSPVTITP